MLSGCAQYVEFWQTTPKTLRKDPEESPKRLSPNLHWGRRILRKSDESPQYLSFAHIKCIFYIRQKRHVILRESSMINSQFSHEFARTDVTFWQRLQNESGSGSTFRLFWASPDDTYCEMSMGLFECYAATMSERAKSRQFLNRGRYWQYALFLYSAT